MIVLDIESEAIVPGQPCLPRPVGAALYAPETGDRQYLAWGHPEGNNCTIEHASGVIRSVWDLELVTHNGLAFDIPDFQHWFKLPRRAPLLTHDTLFLAYLHDPHSPELGLKWLAENWLGIPATDQSELYDWIMANTDCPSRSKCGAYISQAPGDLVGKYAEADVHMTWELFKHLRDRVLPAMQQPYDRERLLAPILVDMQCRGVRVDRDRLAVDYLACSNELDDLTAQIRNTLEAPELNLDSDRELIATLQERGFTGFGLTQKGALSANKESLEHALASAPDLLHALRRRGQLSTLVRTFMGPWLAQSEATGRIHPSYNQVRNPEGYGTRTGRMSSSNPNLTNVPNRMDEGLPLMKSYILPEEGHEWTCADFKSQEPRLAAHFEDGLLMQAYLDDPEKDIYMYVAELAGVLRKQAKTIFLGLLYGMGAQKLGDQLGITKEQANTMRNAVRGAVPGLNELVATCTRHFRHGLSIRTLGGRQYFCEPPREGMTFEYKAANVLIQGSAADQSKEALIYAAPRLAALGARIVSFVHDEYSVSHLPEVRDEVYQIIKDSAMALPVDVPMLMDINTGDNWSEAK